MYKRTTAKKNEREERKASKKAWPQTNNRNFSTSQNVTLTYEEYDRSVVVFVVVVVVVCRPSVNPLSKLFCSKAEPFMK